MKRKFLIVIILSIILFCLLATVYYPYALEVREYKILNKNIPDNFVGLKIVHFSDIHYGTTIKEKELKQVVNKINKLKPEIVIFTGDLFDKDITYSDNDLEILKNNLLNISGDLGKFAVSGNHDYENNLFNTIMDEANFKVLNNTYSLVFNNNITPILIGGVPSSIKDKLNYEDIFNYHQHFSEDEVVPKFKILLMHEPDNIINIEEYDVDLVLAGHSHNGQVRLPFIGALYMPKGAKTYYDQYYRVDNTDLFISGGLGTTRLPIRLFNQQSINLYRLYNN